MFSKVVLSLHFNYSFYPSSYGFRFTQNCSVRLWRILVSLEVLKLRVKSKSAYTIFIFIWTLESHYFQRAGLGPKIKCCVLFDWQYFHLKIELIQMMNIQKKKIAFGCTIDMLSWCFGFVFCNICARTCFFLNDWKVLINGRLPVTSHLKYFSICLRRMRMSFCIRPQYCITF